MKRIVKGQTRDEKNADISYNIQWGRARRLEPLPEEKGVGGECDACGRKCSNANLTTFRTRWGQRYYCGPKCSGKIKEG